MKNLVPSQEAKDNAIENAQTANLVARKVYQIHTGDKGSKTGFDALKSANGGRLPHNLKRSGFIGFMAACGYCTVNNRGLLETNDQGDETLLRTVAGNTAVSYHKKEGNIDETGLTSDGLVWFNNAMQGQGIGGYDAEVKAVRAVRNVVSGKAKDATLELDGIKPVKIKRVSEVVHMVPAS